LVPVPEWALASQRAPGQAPRVQEQEQIRQRVPAQERVQGQEPPRQERVQWQQRHRRQPQ
jgi:hypothetical protein